MGEPMKRRQHGPGDPLQWKSTIILLLLVLLVFLQLKHSSVEFSNANLLKELSGGSRRTVADSSLAAVSCNASCAGSSCGCQCGNGTGSSRWAPRYYDTCELAVVGGRKRDGYGSWPLCLNHVPPNAIVYSFGIGLDASFDAVMIRRGGTVYGFDPTIKPQSIPPLFGPQSKQLLHKFHFMQVGLGSSNGVATFYKAKKPGIQSMTALGHTETGQAYQNVGFQAAVLTLPALMAIHGHDHVDLLKVDIEGFEFYVCEQQKEFLDALPRVGQVVYEFHERLISNPAGRKDRCIELLKSQGLALVNKTLSEEYVFARVNPGASIVYK